MENFELLAKPWWINLLIFIPIVAYYIWKKKGGITVSKKTLLISAFFGIAFGVVEATVVIYLRASVGLLPGYGGTLAQVAKLSSDIYQQAMILSTLPKSFVSLEFMREVATMVMLVSVAFLAERSTRGRFAVFLWTFAVWDISYYAWLWFTVKWPVSLLSPDVLFLIPVPWFSQVWFALLVSVLTMGAVWVNRK